MRIVGIYFDPPYVRISLIVATGRGAEIALLKAALPGDVKQLYIKNFPNRIASCLPAKDCLIRQIEVKATGKHREEAIAFQAEAESHLNPEDVLTTALIEGQKALLFTISKEAMGKHLKELSQIGIDPDAVSTPALALCHFANWKLSDLEDALIVDIGTKMTLCVCMEGKKLKKAHTIAIGSEDLIESAFEDRKKVLLRREIEPAAKQTDLLQLHKGLNPHLTNALQSLKQEIAKTFYAFYREEKKPIVMTGRVDTFLHLQEFLVEGALKGLSLEEQKFAIPIGLALEQMNSQHLQLRQKEFFPDKNWKQMGKYAVCCLAASVIAAGALLGISSAIEHQKRNEMAANFHLKNGKEETIERWIASVETHNKEYPYISQAPTAAEVLQWLSLHPLMKEDPIEIEEIRYQLVHFPTVHTLKDPYQAKVELKFRSKNPRKFHEALKIGDQMVDPNKEISWESLHDGYVTSFFLKNRTPHVF